jgi:hypothetical protein
MPSASRFGARCGPVRESALDAVGRQRKLKINVRVRNTKEL